MAASVIRASEASLTNILSRLSAAVTNNRPNLDNGSAVVPIVVESCKGINSVVTRQSGCSTGN